MVQFPLLLDAATKNGDSWLSKCTNQPSRQINLIKDGHETLFYVVSMKWKFVPYMESSKNQIFILQLK